MKRLTGILLLLSVAFTTNAQTIKGTVTDNKGNGLPGANVYIEGSYDGASTDENGNFEFKTNLQGKQNLIVKFVGFNDYQQEIDLSENAITLNIKLRESSKSLDAVVISAGSFEASDKKKGVVLKPLDILTTAGGLGDIYGALQTLPGTQVVGEEGKIFVRGGASYETKTFFDGMLIEQPYYSQIPNIPTRGRFSPWLFTGTVFSSGGYSAEYGQAMSSALILESQGLAEEDVSSVSLMSIGFGASHTKRWDKTSLSLSGGYTNLGPYFGLIEQEYEWEIAPRGWEGNMIFRQKAGKDGLIKSYASFGYGRNKLEYPNINDPEKLQIVDLKEYNGYFNTTYKDVIGEKWVSFAGVSYSNDRSDYQFDKDELDEKVQVTEGKYTVTYLANDIYKIKFGADFQHKEYKQNYFIFDSNSHYNTVFTDNLSATFAETEFTIGPRFALRLGGRFEHSSLLDKTNIAPRFSLAFKTGKESQISLAYGDFYQIPEDEFVRFSPALNYEKARHYIINYQIMKNKRIFRIEAYYKDYKNLVKFDSLYSPYPESYNNDGHGYAKGIDVLWRDYSIDYMDYWLSYGYIDTQRDFLDYPEMATPIFISNHNFRAVFKYFIVKINSQVGFTYTFTSGRPYFNPNNEEFHGDETKSYHDLSFNMSYLTNLWDNFTVIYLSVGNLLGRDNVFGYNYSSQPNSSGTFDAYAIKPMAKRFIFIGVFISLTE